MMRHLSSCALLMTLAVGCDFDKGPNNNNPDGGADSGPTDSGSSGSSGGRGGAGGGTTTGGHGGSNSSNGGGGAAAQGGSTANGGGGTGGGTGGAASGGASGGGVATGGMGGGSSTPDDEGGTGGNSEAGGVGGESSGGVGAPAPDDGGDAGIAEPAMLQLMRFEGIVAQVAARQTVRATVEWLNASSVPIFVTRALITGRAPGATPAAGPYDDFDPSTESVTVAPGASLTVTASLLPREVMGEWLVYPTYADTDGVYRDFAGTTFTMVTDPEYGTFDNSIWPVAQSTDSPNEDRRFAIACYKTLPTGDSARCTARYGLGSLPYQVSPSNLMMLQTDCMSDGGVLLTHACPTNQMLQLCWEDTRSPAYSYSCEYYGDPNNKSPQFPGAAPDIVYYNDNYLGRDPQP